MKKTYNLFKNEVRIVKLLCIINKLKQNTKPTSKNNNTANNTNKLEFYKMQTFNNSQRIYSDAHYGKC